MSQFRKLARSNKKSLNAKLQQKSENPSNNIDPYKPLFSSYIIGEHGGTR